VTAGAAQRGSWFLGLLLAVCAAAEAAPGESIYRDGILLSGAPLTAKRAAGLSSSGAAAACANCHRRSGLGEIEGRVVVPPVSGTYLFADRAGDHDDSDLPYVDTVRPDRDPYTPETFARAVRDGVDVNGRKLSELMPRYSLGDADMRALTEYLRGMTPTKVPGVGSAVLDFATIITPDADPVRRAGMLDVLEHFFADKDAFARAESPRMRSSHRMMFKANRRWVLHVWELHGPADGWEAQLREHLAREPVFAVISGLGGANWGPVHHFCNAVGLPCLFPNTDVPVVAEQDFYTLYLSKGVWLEAGLIAGKALEERAVAGGPRRIVQVFRAGDVGVQAAAALRAALPAGADVVDREVSAHASSLDRSVAGLGANDLLVLWLRPADLASISGRPVRAGHVLVSGLLGGLDQAPLSAPWRHVSEMTYPFDLPDQRRIRMDYPLGWFRIRGIRVVDERVQADTYLACGLLAEALSHMSDSFIRDYLVERMEGMLEHRILTAYYPRLALAPQQRFASKGGYLVRFAAEAGSSLTPDGDWLVPQ
jgi:hypothetical protein